MVMLSKRWWNGTRGLELVEATPHGRSVMWLRRPANTWWITNLIKLIIAPWTPINTPCRWNSHTTVYLKFSTCKGSDLVVEVQVKPYQELRVESSLHSSSGSSLRDRWALVSLPVFIDFKSQFLYVMFLFCLELWCVHSYYHLVPLVCCYCSMCYMSDSVDYSSSS
jgi:hypothetical protein